MSWVTPWGEDATYLCGQSESGGFSSHPWTMTGWVLCNGSIEALLQEFPNPIAIALPAKAAATSNTCDDPRPSPSPSQATSSSQERNASGASEDAAETDANEAAKAAEAAKSDEQGHSQGQR